MSHEQWLICRALESLRTCAWGWWLTCGFGGIKLTEYIRYTVMFLISTQPTASFTRLQIRSATPIFHSQKLVSIIQHFTISYSEACETFRWVRPTLRSDTLKIKAIDLCTGRDSLPAWHAALLCGLSVNGAVCVCVCLCVCASTRLYKIICACLCVSIYVARVKLGSLCKPVRRVHGSLKMEVGL